MKPSKKRNFHKVFQLPRTKVLEANTEQNRFFETDKKQKTLQIVKFEGFKSSGGADGTRTRDPVRDRHVF